MLPVLNDETRKQKRDTVFAYFAKNPEETPASLARINSEINDFELVFLSEYIEKESRAHGQSSTLSYLLDTENQFTSFQPKEASAHDEKIAYTMIQWLGSNVGMDFIRDTFEKTGYEIVKKSEKKKTFIERLRS